MPTNILTQVQNIKPDETIKTIITYLEKSGFGSEFYRFEPTLARSFSYSQGPIWESRDRGLYCRLSRWRRAL